MGEIWKLENPSLAKSRSVGWRLEGGISPAPSGANSYSVPFILLNLHYKNSKDLDFLFFFSLSVFLSCCYAEVEEQ